MDVIDDSLDVYIGVFTLVLFLGLLIPVFFTLGKGVDNLKVREDKSTSTIQDELIPIEPKFSLAEIDLMLLIANSYQTTANCLVTPDKYAFILAADYLANQDLFLKSRKEHSKENGNWIADYYNKNYSLKLGIRSASKQPYAFLFE